MKENLNRILKNVWENMVKIKIFSKKFFIHDKIRRDYCKIYEKS